MMGNRPQEVMVVDDGALYLKELSRERRRPNFLRNGLPRPTVKAFTPEEKLAALGLSDPD